MNSIVSPPDCTESISLMRIAGASIIGAAAEVTVPDETLSESQKEKPAA